MKKKVISQLLIIGCFVLLLLSCKTQVINELSDIEKDEISKEIESLVDSLFNPNINYESYIDLRADQEGYLLASDGKVLFKNYESFKSAAELSFENIQEFLDMKSTETYVYVLSNDAAISTSEFHERVLTLKGDTIVRTGCWTMVFKKFEKEWKIIHENGTHTEF